MHDCSVHSAVCDPDSATHVFHQVRTEILTMRHCTVGSFAPPVLREPASRKPNRMKSSCRMILLTGLAASALSHAERLPVLQQIDLPHPYYFREMYLPQLTSGPTSPAVAPASG